MSNGAVQVHESWLRYLAPEFDADYMQELRAYLLERKKQRKVIYPPSKEIFNALNTTHFDDVKVVIIGQDPYHGPSQAHGLCFSVKAGVAVPPSLRNIFTELNQDLGVKPAEHGCLQSWAEQGVLLLNAVLTVEQGQAGAHQGKGWERFTDAVIAALNEHRDGLVFMLWGGYAQKKGAVIDPQRHTVLKAPHPSPLSAHRGFFGCRHFSQVNQLLEQKGIEPIEWALPPLSEAHGEEAATRRSSVGAPA